MTSTGTARGGDELVALVAAELAEELPDAMALRRRLHADPRLSGFEDDTAEAVCAAIVAGGGLVTPPQRVAGTGRLLRLGPVDGPAVALRAELDGLPVRERTGLPFASESGVMHACGHDLHCAALVALARAVRRVVAVGRAELPVGLLLVLQPREETAPSGAADVLADPTFAGHDVRAVIAAHVQPALPRGVVSARPGPVNASCFDVVVTVTGRGGHAAYPQRIADPVLALSATVVALHHLVSRRVDPLAAAVLTVGQLAAGSAHNVVPSVARAYGTIRALNPVDRRRLRTAAREMVEHTAAAYGCYGVLEVVENEPALRNDPRLASAVLSALAELGLRPDDEFRSCGSDDFAHFSDALPAVMLFVGIGDPRAPAGGFEAPGLHDARFAPPDDVVGELATAYLAGLSGALRLLATSR